MLGVLPNNSNPTINIKSQTKVLLVRALNVLEMICLMIRAFSLIKPMVLLLCLTAVVEGYGQSEALRLFDTGRHSLGIFTGSTALIGIDYARPVGKKTWLRSCFSYMDFDVRDWETNFNRYEQYASINLSVRNSSLSLLIDHVIAPKLNLRFVTGIGLFLMNDFSGSIKLRDPLKINDIYFEPDELGYVYGGLRYNLKLNPYFGVALGRLTHPNRRLTVGLDIGTFYKGAPEVFINGTALIRNNEHNAEILTNNMSGYRWFPVFNLRFGYSIDPKDNP